MAAADFCVWEGVYPSFAEAPVVGPGFSGAIWVERNAREAHDAAASLSSGRPFDYALRQRYAVLPVLAAQALRAQEQVSVLDFGGGLGAGYLLTLACVPTASQRLRYTIVEVDSVCRSAEDIFPSGKGPRYLADLPASGPFDIVHTASTMQYVGDWQAVVARLAGLEARTLIFADMFAGEIESYVTLQNYYGSRIAHWLLNKDEFVASVERHGYTLTSRTLCDAKVLGRFGALPMDNLPPGRRLAYTSHFVFGKTGTTG